MIVVLVLVVTAVIAGLSAAAAIRHWPQADPASAATHALGEELGRSRQARSFLRSRLDPGTATGLALTVSMIGAVVAGGVIGILILMIRANTGFVVVDHSAARWAGSNTGATATRVLEVITLLGSTPVIVAVAVAGAVYGIARWRSPSIPLFFLVVVLGQFLTSNAIKFAVDRARPDLHPLVGFSGPSFPSGHSTAAAATYAALALVMARGRSPRVRAALAGIAVGIAVAVACSRVFLGVHWASDVVAGLLLGWAWFGLCSVAFGGRFLRFGAPAKEAAAGPAFGAVPPREGRQEAVRSLGRGGATER